MEFRRRASVTIASAAILVLGLVPRAASPASHRVVAVGDIHGDLDALAAVLRSQELVDSDGHWSGADAKLVLTGDLNDRGPDTRLVFDWVMSLEKESAAAGGEVIALLGNHELMAVEGDNRYTTSEEFASFADMDPGGDPQKGYERAMRGPSPYADWLRGRRAMVVIDGVLYLHGGFGKWLERFDPDRVNAMVRARISALQGLTRAMPPRSEEWVTGPDGPLWDRKVAQGAFSAGDLDRILAARNIKAVVLGHTPQTEVTLKYGGKVILIDTGMCRVYGGQLSSVEMRDGKAVPKVAERPAYPSELRMRIERRLRPAAQSRAPVKETRKPAVAPTHR